MKSGIHTRAIMILLTLSMLLPSLATAHNLWLNATDFNPPLSQRAGAHSKVYFGFGHKFPVDDFLSVDKIREFNLVGPMGSVPLKAEPGNFPAAPIVMKQAGAYTVTAATNTGFYTMFEKNGRVQHISATMEGVENIVLSIYFENYAKALINVGETSSDAFSQPVGHAIEIVPLENPYHKRVGDYLPVQVLHHGKPARYATVAATYVGFSSGEDYAWSSKTNSLGNTSIRLLAPGQWIALVTIRTPPTDELKDKCLEIKYSAALSFGVQ